MKKISRIKNAEKCRLIWTIAAVIITAIALIYIYYVNAKPEFRLVSEAAFELEYGESYEVDGIAFIDTAEYSEKQLKDLEENLVVESDLQNEEDKDYPAIGTYVIKLEYKNNTLTKNIIVEDTTPPELATEYSSIDIVQGTDLSGYDFQSLFSFNDLSPCTFGVDFTEIDTSTVGSYTLKAIVTDEGNNSTETSIAVNITQSADENQEIVTEIVTNEDGTKSIVNTIKEKEVITENETSNTDISAVSDGSSSTSSDSSSTSSDTSSASDSNSSDSKVVTATSDSFVANMSISQQCTQAIVVVGDGGSYATLTLHTKVNGVWVQQLSCSARVGKNGITSSKKEGDGKTPAGIYSLGQAFGVASNPGTSRNWLQVNDNHYWVDDSTSPYYNQLVDASQTGIQWSSAEHLASYTTAYKYAIAVNYNTDCTPYAGSAIFLHCSTGGSTAGCISISESNMIKILQSLQSDTLIGIYDSSDSLY